MKFNVLFVVAFNLGCGSFIGQINLIGTYYNTNTQLTEVLEWQALNPNSVTAHETELDAIFLASSVFDAYNSIYFLGAISNGSTVLFQFNSDDNSQSLSNSDVISNVAEIDMSSGNIYSLRVEDEGEISVYEYNYAENEQIQKGIIYEPGVEGIVVDAIGFDSNNGILYYVGFDSMDNTCLFSIPVREEEFSYTKTCLVGIDNLTYVTSLQYDNSQQKLFALKRTVDEEGVSLSNAIVEIDLSSGELMQIVDIEGFSAFLVASSAFDQNSGSYMLVGFNSSLESQMIVANTMTNTYETGFVPGNVTEIVCDNADFAASAYGINKVTESSLNALLLFPNPATSELNLIQSLSSENTELVITDVSGKTCYTGRFNGTLTRLSVDHLEVGYYLVTVKNRTSTSQEVLIVR
jgi:hypothetical protein